MRIDDAEMKQNEFYLSDYTSKAQKKKLRQKIIF